MGSNCIKIQGEKMSKEEIMNSIKQALENAVGEAKDFTEATDLIEDDVVDSLDSALFLVELEKEVGFQIPQADVNDKELMLVGNLVNYLTEKRA